MRYGVSEEPDLTKPTITYGHGWLEDFGSEALWGSIIATADGGNLVTTVDAERTEADDYWNGFYIKYTSGSNAGLYRLITDFDAASDTITHLAFPNNVVAGNIYVMSCWLETLSGMTAGQATPTIVNGDTLQIQGVCDGAGDEYVSYYRGFTNISSAINTKLVVRWKTSAIANGLQAKITVLYTDATSTETTLGFSTGWKVTTVSLDTAKTIYGIRLIADDNPNTVAAGTFYVYFDFVLICQGIFTWPFTGGVKLRGHNNNQYLKPVGKVGNATQYLGADGSTLQVYGDIDSTGVDALGVPVINSGWHGRWTTHDGEAFYQLLHNANTEPWNWFTSDVASLKVTVDDFEIDQVDTSKNLLWYQLDIHEYRLGSAGSETSLERFGIT